MTLTGREYTSKKNPTESGMSYSYRGVRQRGGKECRRALKVRERETDRVHKERGRNFRVTAM